MKIEYLGQSGLKLNLKDTCILVDPYLSNSVQELDSSDLKRKVPIPYKPGEIRNVSFMLFTHEHIDHCDPHTVPIIAKNNPDVKFIGPYLVREELRKWNINNKNILDLKNEEIDLGNRIKVLPIPASHPKLTLSNDGFPRAVGWLIYYENYKIYIAGDTSVNQEIINILSNHPNIDLAILPVNEDNFFRRRRGIIGNMTIREAFQLTEELKIKNLFPVHWDMFEVNSALPEEIKIIHEGYDWKFKLIQNISELRF